MTASVYICECEHPKSQHKRERDGCRAVDCGCAKFEADLKASALAQGAPLMPGGESTSAMLRRVEHELAAVLNDREATLAERNEARGALARVERERAELLSILARIGDALSPTGERPQEALSTLAADVEAFVRLHDVTEEQRDELAAEVRVLKNSEGLAVVRAEVERDLARAELASARTELEQLRVEYGQARDALDREKERRPSWVVARDGGRDCESCDQEIRRGEAYELLDGADRLRHVHCPQPPSISITHRPEGAPA